MEQVNFLHNKNTEIILAYSKKHWFASILPAFLVFLGIAWILSFKIFNIILGLLLLFYAGTRLLANRQTSWMLTNDLLIIKSGFLPWRRVYYEIPKEDIYEAYFTQGIAGSMLKFATIVVRRNDGSASYFSESKMADFEEMIGRINDVVVKLKKSNQHIVANTGEIVSELKRQNANAQLIADELYKLSALKEKGLITDEEFNAQKRKLIN